MRLPGKAKLNVVLLTFCLWEMGKLFRLYWQKECTHSLSMGSAVCKTAWKQYDAMNLLPICHAICCNEIFMEDKVTHILMHSDTPISKLINVTYFLLVLEWNNSANIGAVSLTACWPCHEM